MSQRNVAFAEVEALTRNVEKLDERLSQLDRLAGKAGSAAASNINVHGGGVAVWLAATACVVSLLVIILASVFVASIFTMQNAQILEIKADLNAQTKELRDADKVIHAYINTGQMPAQEEQ